MSDTNMIKKIKQSINFSESDLQENEQQATIKTSTQSNIVSNSVTEHVENSVIIQTSDNNTSSNFVAFNSDELVNDTSPEPNCLALTVRKDYNLEIVKNAFTVTGRLTWKIALITSIINILNMMF